MQVVFDRQIKHRIDQVLMLPLCDLLDGQSFISLLEIGPANLARNQGRNRIKRKTLVLSAGDQDNRAGGAEKGFLERVLRAVQEQLPEYGMPSLSDVDMAFRMHYASYGLIGYTMKIIRGAARIARCLNFFTFALCLSLNRYPRLRSSAPNMAFSAPQ